MLGTSSSESALPRIMAKLEHLGLREAGGRPRRADRLLVQPRRHLDLHDDGGDLRRAGERRAPVARRRNSGILGVLLLTSKGAAAVTGSGFVTLAATLAAFPTIPVAGLTLLLGVDRFMSEARAITNLIGNAVATMVIARWDGALDLERARAILAGRDVDALAEPIAGAVPADRRLTACDRISAPAA